MIGKIRKFFIKLILGKNNYRIINFELNQSLKKYIKCFTNYNSFLEKDCCCTVIVYLRKSILSSGFDILQDTNEKIDKIIEEVNK